MNNDDIFNRWNAWLEVIFDDVQGLLANRRIYQDVQEIVRANPKIQVPSAFYEWMGINYAVTQATGLRRQVDPRPDVISFANFLGEIKEQPAILDRQRYVALHVEGGLPDKRANSDFDRLAGKGKPHINPDKVEADLTEMKQKVDKIRIYANKRITRFDHSDFRSVPTFPEINDSLDFLETLLAKYLRLFRANAPLTLVPVWKYDWKKVFRTPWLEEE